MAAWLEQVIESSSKSDLRNCQSHLPVDSTPSWKLETCQYVWIKKKQSKYDDLISIWPGQIHAIRSALKMKISVSWKNLLNKSDNIDWINTITRRKLIYG